MRETCLEWLHETVAAQAARVLIPVRNHFRSHGALSIGYVYFECSRTVRIQNLLASSLAVSLMLCRLLVCICGVLLLLKICSNAATDCSRRVMDLVFVVATPDSMQSSFNAVRDFIGTLVGPMNIGNNVRVGLVT